MTSSFRLWTAQRSSQPNDTATRLSGRSARYLFRRLWERGGVDGDEVWCWCGFACHVAQCSEAWAWASSAAQRSSCTNIEKLCCSRTAGSARFWSALGVLASVLLPLGFWLLARETPKNAPLRRKGRSARSASGHALHRTAQSHQRLRENHAGGSPGQQPRSAEPRSVAGEVSPDGAVGARSRVCIARRRPRAKDVSKAFAARRGSR